MLETTAADYRKIIDIDLTGQFIMAKAVLPSMIKKGHGKIINICSMMSELGRETVVGYASAKGGLKMLTKNICSEFGEKNIQCNGIGPGYIATPQTAPLREIQPDGSRHPFDQFIISKTPAGRWGKPDDLAGAAIFLASDASNIAAPARSSGLPQRPWWHSGLHWQTALVIFSHNCMYYFKYFQRGGDVCI